MLNIKKCLLLAIISLSATFGSADFLPDLLVHGLAFGLNAGDFISKELLPVDLPPQNSSYDFIIVGAGPAGCVLANRLSENPNWTVFLLEAGGQENFAHDIPALVSILPLTDSNWGYMSVPQKNSCQGMNNNVCAQPRGKVLGGTSALNFMIQIRGNRKDYDSWAEAGNTGWSYEDVLPFFLRSEAANLKGLEKSPFHNTTGPLSVEYPFYRTKIVDAFVEGAQQAGHKYVDYNGDSQIGVSYVQGTTKKGHRHTAAKAYLDPIKNKRKNLHIITFAHVTKILIDQVTKSAYGVKFLRKGKEYTIRAKKEVIISSGAFNSPQLLMLSGIGPKDVLTRIGVPIIQELPVGKILYDHISHFGPVFTCNTTLQTLFTDRLGPLDLIKFQTGDPSTRFSTLGGVEALAFIKTPNSKQPNDVPDAELVMVATSMAGDYGTGLKEGGNFREDIFTKMFKPLIEIDHFGFIIFNYHPESVGSLYLQDSNPTSPPIIDPNYFSVKEDIEFIVEAIHEVIRISKTPAMQKINATLHTIPTPGCENIAFASDDYWRCSIKVLSYTLHHQIGTCKMGPRSDPTSVVSPQLKVHGMRKLRVADTSVISKPPTAHTNAVSFMIGEKLSDMIKEEWQGK